MNRRLCSLVTLAALAMTRAASAEEDAAGALFAEGLEAMDKGRYADACPKIARSNDLDPRPGTLFTLAECEWKWGRTASALARYEAYLSLLSNMTPEQRGKQSAREPVAKAQVKTLTAQVPKASFSVSPAGTSVTYALDGAPIAESQDVRVDPGEHVVTATTATTKRSERFTVKNGEHARVALDLSAGGTDLSFRERLAARPDRVTLYVAGGLGAVGVVTGIVFAGLTLGAKSTVSDHCGIGGNDRACDAEGKSAADRGQAFGWISTAALGIGLVGLVTATALWFARDEAPKRTTVARGW